MSTPVTPQEFREAAAKWAHLAKGERLMKDDLGQRTAEAFERDAALLLAAAEQCEAHDRMMTMTAERLSHYEATIDTLTAERDEARATIAKIMEHVQNPLTPYAVYKDLMVILDAPTRPA